MPITKQQAETVAGGVAAAHERTRRQFRRSEHNRVPPPDIGQALGGAAFDAMRRVALAAGGDELVDVRHTYTYVTALTSTTFQMTLLVATDRRLWVVYHVGGQVGEPWAVPYEAIRPVGKRLTGAIKVAAGPQAVRITASRSVAGWLQALQAQRPTQPAAWLASPAPGTVAAQAAHQAPPGWHPDPRGRHELRWWNGFRWSEHVSDAGAQTIDPLG